MTPVVLAARGAGRSGRRHGNDVSPADTVHARVDAEPRCVSDGLGDLRGIDEHLGRYAPDIEAGAAEDAVLEIATRLSAYRSSRMVLPEPEPMIARSKWSMRILAWIVLRCRCFRRGTNPASGPVRGRPPAAVPPWTGTRRAWRPRSARSWCGCRGSRPSGRSASRRAPGRLAGWPRIFYREELRSDRRIRFGTPTSSPRCSRVAVSDRAQPAEGHREPADRLPLEVVVQSPWSSRCRLRRSRPRWAGGRPAALNRDPRPVRRRCPRCAGTPGPAGPTTGC